MDKIPSPYTSTEFAPYALALGQLTLSWNALQDAFGEIFQLLMQEPPIEGRHDDRVAAHAWAAINSDRNQRQMLKAIAQNPSPQWRIRQRWSDELIWAISKADALEDLRNNAVHAPLVKLSDLALLFSEKTDPITPKTWGYNKRAHALIKRGVLEEYIYCRDVSIALQHYVESIARYLVNPSRECPPRPNLPSRSPEKKII